MARDPEAEEIEREREHRRSDERRRIAGERARRRAEVDRLKERPLPTEGAIVSPGPPPPPSEPRPIGRPILPTVARALLDLDPAERFDVQGLNRVPLAEVAENARGDSELAAELRRRLAELMVRVKHEEDDPNGTGAFLRARVLDWYRRSAETPGWSTEAAESWAGLFADSRTSGGRLLPWLNLRLLAAHESLGREGRLPRRLRQGLLPDRRVEEAVGRTPAQQIQSEVAQAILDDLAARPRDPEVPLPMVRLSELAVRRQTVTINDTLAVLFNSPEHGPFVILHPNRYPGCEETVIRPPAPGTMGAALAYSLGPVRSGRRSPVRLHLSADGVAVAASDEAERDAALDPEGSVDADTIWDADPVASRTWSRVVQERRQERRRLDPPPRDFRARPAFGPLKQLILEDAEFRKSLLAVRWRGRPTGLPLLVALLQKGRFTPEVATDHEYLEAELGEWVQGDPQWRPSDGVWVFEGWTVRREATSGAGPAYRAERTGGTAGSGT